MIHPAQDESVKKGFSEYLYFNPIHEENQVVVDETNPITRANNKLFGGEKEKLRQRKNKTT